MNELNGSSTPGATPQPSSANGQQDMTPQRSALSRSRLNQNHLLKHLNSPTVVSNAYATQQQASLQQTPLPQFQQQIGAQGGMQGHHFPQSSISTSPSRGAFDQNTYMQLLQRQNSLNRSGLGGRPQSRGRVGGDNIFQGQNQTLNFGDSSILMSPNSNQLTGGKLNMTAGAPQGQNVNGAPNLTKINNMNWNDISQQYQQNPLPTTPQQQTYIQQQQQPKMPTPKNHTSQNNRSNSQTGAQNSNSQSFLNQTQNNQQFDMLQQSQLGMYRNTSQPALNINFDQLQMIAQLLQNPNQAQQQNFGHQQPPQQPFDQQQIIQQLLFQQQQQQQTPQQQANPTATQAQSHLSQRQTMPGMAQPNFPPNNMMFNHQPSHSQHFSQVAAPGQNNPQLQQISANVNEYRRLVENYKNSNSMASSGNVNNLHSITPKQPHPAELQQQQFVYGQLPFQAVPLQQQTQGNTSFENDRNPLAGNNDGQGGPQAGIWSQQNAMPSYESFMASQQFTLGGQKSQDQLASTGQSSRPGLHSGRSGDQHDAYVGVRQFQYGSSNSHEAAGRPSNMNDSDRVANDVTEAQDGRIAWPSRHVTLQNSGEKTLDNPRQNQQDSRSMPQFQSEEDNSAILEGRALLGALNGSSGVGQSALDGQQQTLFRSKQLSPIQLTRKHDEIENNSSFLKTGQDDMNTQDASQVIMGNTTVKENEGEQNDMGEGICWISQQQLPRPSHTDSDGKRESERAAANQEEELLRVQKRLFSEDAPLQSDNVDVDNLVIHKQEKTFEEMLESQLKKSLKPEKMIIETVPKPDTDQVVTFMHIDAEEQPPITPVKDDGRKQTAKKAFLRRGSSQKYDPQQARKQSCGSTKKFKYYTDNFQKGQGPVAAAPKGTSGIPSLSISKQVSSQLSQPEKPKVQKKKESPSQHQSPKKQAVARKPVTKRESKQQDVKNITDLTNPFLEQPNEVKEPKIIEPMQKSPSQNKKQKPAANGDGSTKNTGRLKPPPNERSHNSSRLKFNAPSSKVAAQKLEQSNEKDKARKGEKSRNQEIYNKKSSAGTSAEPIAGAIATSEETKAPPPTQTAQKVSSSRLAQSKQLFRKTNAQSHAKIEPPKSVETKEPPQALKQVPSEDLQVWAQCTSEQLKEVVPIVNEVTSSNQTPNGNLESSMCDEREDSFIEKNSIAEFEMLEQACFQEEATTERISRGKKVLESKVKTSKATISPSIGQKSSKSQLNQNTSVEKIQIQHDSPIRQNARELLNHLKSSSSEKQSHKSDERKIDKLQQQLMELISEQEKEVSRLKEENVRVAILQGECQRQLERLNKEASEQDKAKKLVNSDVKKLNKQLKSKEEETIRLQESLIDAQEQNQKLQTQNQTLTGQLDRIKTIKKEESKETQTEKPSTRHIMIATTPLKVAQKETQVEAVPKPELLFNDGLSTPTEKTPEKCNVSHLTLENEGSVPVSPDAPSPQQQVCDFSDLLINPSLDPNKEVSEESCEVVETDAARGAEIVKSARTAVGMPLNSQQTKQAKIVTFNLDESQEQKVVATTQSQDEEARDVEHEFSNGSHEEELPSQMIDEHASDQDADEFEVEEEDYDLVFPEQYHSDEAYKNLVLSDEVVSTEGKRQKFYECGKKEIIFPNGVKREVWTDGYQVVFFQNQDIKQTFPGGKIVYFFSDAKTTQTTFPDGLQVFKFQNNQIEKHFPDGTKEISFPDGTIKCLFADGEEESIFPDGTIQKIEKNGLRIIEYAHGQRDYMYPDGTKVREYQNGLIKRYNLDGSVETIQQHDVVLGDSATSAVTSSLEMLNLPQQQN